MKRLLSALLLVFIGAAGCAPAVSETNFIDTETPTATASPTATIDWFPATSTPSPAPSQVITPTPTPDLGLGALLLEDDFSQSGDWTVYQKTNGSAAYGIDEFTLAVASPETYLTSLRSEPQLSNFYLEVTANPSLCRSGDNYGLLLRAANEWSYYRWLVTCDGQTRLERVKDGYAVLVQDWLYSAQISSGSETEMRLAVWLAGERMRFFINGVEQFSARDPVWTSGLIGFFARTGGDTPLTVNFSDLRAYAVDPRAVPTITPIPSLTPIP